MSMKLASKPASRWAGWPSPPTCPTPCPSLREDVAPLAASRTQLAADVESMARHLESERNRLRGALSEILKWVDENVQPANSLMGVRPKASPDSGGAGGGEQPSEISAGADVGAPTLNLQNTTGSGTPGATHPL